MINKPSTPFWCHAARGRILGQPFYRHFSIFGAIFDAQGVPLAAFGAPFPRQRGSKRVRARSTESLSEPFGLPFSIQNAPWTDFSDFWSILNLIFTKNVARATCNVPFSMYFSHLFLIRAPISAPSFVYFWHVFASILPILFSHCNVQRRISNCCFLICSRFQFPLRLHLCVCLAYFCIVFSDFVIALLLNRYSITCSLFASYHKPDNQAWRNARVALECNIRHP